MSKYADNTIVVLWSDHGWHHGEKEHWRKFTLWQKGTPALILDPGIKHSATSRDWMWNLLTGK
jgi:arylsulfatase A-like enzyme